MCIVLHVFSMFFPLLFILEKKKEINLYSVVYKLGELSPIRVQPSSWRLGMSCSLHDIWFWQVGSCIHGLLPRGGSGPCLGGVPCHEKKKKFGELSF